MLLLPIALPVLAALATPAPPEVVSFWQMTYLPQTVESDADEGDDKKDKKKYAGIEKAVDQINNLFKGSTAAHVVASYKGSVITLRGTPKEVRSAKLMLAMEMDVPYPRIRVGVWTLQINELKHRAPSEQRRMQLIRSGLAEAKSLAQDILSDLSKMAKSENPIVDERLPAVYPWLAARPTTWSPSLVPMRLAFANREKLQDRIKSFMSRSDCLFYKHVARLKEDPNLKDLGKRIDAAKSGLMSQYVDAVMQTQTDERQQCLLDLSNDWGLAIDRKAAPLDVGDGAERVRDDVYAVNRMLAKLSEAFSDDIGAVTFAPLTDWADDITAGGRGNGLDSSGRTGIAVTSGQGASLSGSMTETRTYTKPITLTADNIKSIFGLPDAANAGATVLSLLTQPATVTSEALTPGVSLKVYPTVRPDGSSARVVIEATSSVQGKDPADQTAIDAINSLTAKTDVPVATYDLLELATIAAENTALGDISWRIPILEGLPIIGSAFRGPRRRDTKVHQAMVLVSVGILPDAGDMMRTAKPPTFDIPDVPVAPAGGNGQ